MTAISRSSATALIAVSLFVLGGCASADPAPVADSPPAVSGPALPDDSGTNDGADEGSDGSSDEGATDAGDGTTAQAGAYVDYREGIIAETAGTKALFFHASWCTQCRALEESILSGDIPDDLTIIKADFDTETGLRQQYGVTLQTTIVFVDDAGEALSSTVLYSDTTLDALVAAAP